MHKGIVSSIHRAILVGMNQVSHTAEFASEVHVRSLEHPDRVTRLLT